MTAAGFWLSFAAVAAILFAAAGVPRVRRESRPDDVPDNVDPMVEEAALAKPRAGKGRRLLAHAGNATRAMADRLADSARVQWAAEGDDGSWSAGLKFVNISPAQSDWLAKFLTIAEG